MLYARTSALYGSTHAAVLCPGFVSTRIYDSERYGVNSDAPQKSNPKRGNNQFRGKEFVQKGIPSDIVGERLVEALNAKEFYIFTHPGFREIIKQRATAIDEAFARAETSSLLQNINQEIPHSF